MLVPKKVKFRKWHTARKNPIKQVRAETRGTDLNFGQFGLKAMTQSRITSNQIEAARKALTRAAGKTGKIWIRIFPDKPITKKPLEVRQGSGKGNVEYWVALVQPGRVMFEIEGVTEDLAREALGLAAAKLPVKTAFIARTIM